MGVIEQGILGGFSGKVGPVVGSRWKGINYMRGYVIPANPKTDGQKAVRGQFGRVSNALSQFLYASLRPYADRVAIRQSGFNLAVRASMDAMRDNSPTAFEPVFLCISAGPLDPVVFVGAAALGLDLTVSFERDSTQDPAGDNEVDIYVVRKVDGVILGSSLNNLRGAETAEITLPTAWSPVTMAVLGLAHTPAADPIPSGSWGSSWGTTALDAVARYRSHATFAFE